MRADHQSQTGRDRQSWLMGKIKEVPSFTRETSHTNTRSIKSDLQIVDEYASVQTVAVEEFEHSWLQNSIVRSFLPSFLLNFTSSHV